MKYRYQLVDRMPKEMREGVVYHTEEFGLAGLLCACGCGHRVTLLVPDSHEVSSEGGYVTIRPSVGVLDAPCKSHYVISAGNIQWLPPFTDRHAASIMHAQIARHVARDGKPTSWWETAKAAVLRIVGKLRAFFKR